LWRAGSQPEGPQLGEAGDFGAEFRLRGEAALKKLQVTRGWQRVSF